MKDISFGTVAAVFLVVSAAPAGAVPVSGDPVLYWNELMLGPSYNPGQTRPAALLNIALHDAVNATVGRPNKAFLGQLATAGGDTRAAAAVAARDVLVTLYPARTAAFDAALAGQLALIPNGAAKTNGMATGATIAAATIANRANDGTFAVVNYTASGLPGRWAPTPPGFGPPVGPQLATVTPYIISSADQFGAPPPLMLNTAAYASAFNEVREIGSALSLTRTADQSLAARYWESGTGPGPWIRAAIDLSESRGLSSIESAQILARLSTTLGDVQTATWDSKVFL